MFLVIDNCPITNELSISFDINKSSPLFNVVPNELIDCHIPFWANVRTFVKDASLLLNLSSGFLFFDIITLPAKMVADAAINPMPTYQILVGNTENNSIKVAASITYDNARKAL